MINCRLLSFRDDDGLYKIIVSVAGAAQQPEIVKKFGKLGTYDWCALTGTGIAEVVDKMMLLHEHLNPGMRIIRPELLPCDFPSCLVL